MTLKETLLHELETADDLLLEDLLQVIRGTASRDENRAPRHYLETLAHQQPLFR